MIQTEPITFQCMAHYHQKNKGNLSRYCHLTCFNAKGSDTVQESWDVWRETPSHRGAQRELPPDGGHKGRAPESISQCGHKGLPNAYGGWGGSLRIVPNRYKLMTDSARLRQFRFLVLGFILFISIYPFWCAPQNSFLCHGFGEDPCIIFAPPPTITLSGTLMFRVQGRLSAIVPLHHFEAVTLVLRFTDFPQLHAGSSHSPSVPKPWLTSCVTS